MGRLEEAEEARQQSLAACESAVKDAATAIFPQGKGLAHYRLAELLHATGRTDEARQQFDQAQAIMEDLARRRPKEADCHWQLICLLANCPDEALRDPPRAVALAKRVLPPSAGHYWRYLRWPSTAASSGKMQPTRSSKRWICARAATPSTGCCWRWPNGNSARKTRRSKQYTQGEEAIRKSKPLFYEYLGVMAVQRLQQEAEVLMEGAMENANEEEGERVPSTESGVHGRAVASDRWLCRRQGLELDERYAWED